MHPSEAERTVNGEAQQPAPARRHLCAVKEGLNVTGRELPQRFLLRCILVEPAVGRTGSALAFRIPLSLLH